MKITKLVHSCLIVEKANFKVLVDPGNYSWNSGFVTDEMLKGINYVAITHIHPDHCDDEFVKTVYKQSPNALWFSTVQVAEKLKEFDISVDIKGNDIIRFVNSDHADLSPWFAEQPEHASFVVMDELLIGGDCHTLKSSYGARILAGAINGGPWGSVVGFVKMIENMESRPEVVLPLHDWHWNEDARTAIYSRLPDVLTSLGSEFVPLVNGETFQV